MYSGIEFHYSDSTYMYSGVCFILFVGIPSLTI